MSTIRIRAASHDLANLVAAHLATAGHVTSCGPSTGSAPTLRQRRGLAPEVRRSVAHAIEPLSLHSTVDDDLDVDLEIDLGAAVQADKAKLRVVTDGAAFGESIADDLEAAGFDRPDVVVDFVDAASLHYGGAPRALRQLAQFVLARRGVRANEEMVWHPLDSDVWLHAPDPALAAEPVRSRFEVRVRTDAPDLAAPLVSDLEGRGFRVAVAERTPEDDRRPRFRVAPGPFGAARATAEVRALDEATTALLRAMHVDLAAYPVLVERRSERRSSARERIATIDLPLDAYRRGALRPYAGVDPKRFEVIVKTDVPGAVGGIVAGIEALGFDTPRVEVVAVGARPLRIVAGAAREEPILEDVRRVVDAVASGLAATGTTRPVETRRADGDDPRIVIEVPSAAIADESIDRRVIATARRYNVVLHVPSGADAASLASDLRAVGFRRVRINETSTPDDASLEFGGAPQALIDRFLEVVRRHTEVDVALENAWGTGDADLFLYVPEGALECRAGGPIEPAGEVPDLDRWVHGDPTPSREAFVDARLDGLHVGGVVLARRGGARHPLAPSLEEFGHFCLDALTAETILHVAESVASREPCLLEGDTSTAKTSSVLFLAAHLGQPVARVNLHGQTDTGELVGRFVPRADGDADGPPWRWQEGIVLQAMREGHWLLLDEVNLAEAQILERLNSLLEREPSLVVTEHDHRRLGGRAIHPDFRLFATMNPAEYAGRSALSPAWRDRWRAHRLVPAPGEREIEQFLRASVFGEQPTIEVAGRSWAGGRATAPWGSLARSVGIGVFLAGLARFHVSLDRALAQGDGPGRHRRDRYVVTRRNLLSVLDFLAAHGGTTAAMRQAIVRYYVERIAPADRAVVVRLLDAAGIGPSTWSVPDAARTEAA